MQLDDNYHIAYERLCYFLQQDKGGGYIFISLNDLRLIPSITTSLKEELPVKCNKSTAILYIDVNSDQPPVYQIEQAAPQYEVLLVANFYDLCREDASLLLGMVNLARELLRQLPATLVFFVDEA